MQQRGGQDIPGRGAEGPRRERARLVQGNEAKTAGAGAKRRGGWQKMKTLAAWAGIEPRVFPQARARGLPFRQGDKLLGHRTRCHALIGLTVNTISTLSPERVRVS